MASIYAQFLDAPNTALLAANASIHYVTTTTSINEPNAILKHLQAQLKQVETKECKILNSIEDADGVFLETETTLHFASGGGAYLPSMDENLLDEKLVTFPLYHVVKLDADRKIQQIRLHWDQGTLLKQVGAIGKTGRNWPIRDGKAQVDIIANSLRESGVTPGGTLSLPIRGPNDVVINQRKKGDSVSATNDPHASLSLFKRRDPNEETHQSSYAGPKVATRASAKPAARGFDEIMGDETEQQNGSKVRSSSPTKQEGKAGAGKHHVNNRLFDENQAPSAERSPERKKTYDQKYNHFAFGDGEDAQRPPSVTKVGKGHQQNFTFEDFSTPPGKVLQKPRPDYERHWDAGLEDGEPPSPVKRPIVHQARPDADFHFAIADASPGGPAIDKEKSIQRQKGMALYRNDLFETEKEQDPNTSNATKSRDDTEAHWGFGTPETKGRKIYKTAGDGMGGRARPEGGRGWGIGDESDPEVQADVRRTARSRRAYAEAGAEE